MGQIKNIKLHIVTDIKGSRKKTTMASSPATTVKHVHVHPVTLFTAVDSYERRNEDAKRVVGTLLGNFNNGIVEITNCFTVPHIETQEEVAFDKEYANSMLELYRDANPSEDIMGWFATSNEVTGHSTLIHEYYSIECDHPVHLIIDAQLKSGRMEIKAFISSPMGVPGGTMGIIFTPIPCDVKYYEPELVAIQTFSRNKGGSKKPVGLASGIQHIAKASDQLVDLLKDLLRYVKDVVAGNLPPNPEIGQRLMSLFGSVPQMDPQQVENMMNNNMQELLMVLYLASLTKTQLGVNTKLNSII